MKKNLIYIAFLASVLTMQSCNERTENKMQGETPEAEVPAAVKSAFNARYPGASAVEWEKEIDSNKTVYEVEFKQNKKEIKAKFDANGNFIDEKND